MPITFSHIDGSITLTRAPRRPDKSLAVIQPQRKSAGGTRFGYAHTIINDTLRLQIRATTAEKDQLLTFFNTIARGMAELIGYTDPLGATISCRFAQATLDIIEKAYNAWEITCSLRIFDSAWLFSDGTPVLYSDGTEVT
jgi:hypothetical protein